MSYRIGIDVGGTFTDFVLIPQAVLFFPVDVIYEAGAHFCAFCFALGLYFVYRVQLAQLDTINDENPIFDAVLEAHPADVIKGFF